jgi:hypothetical protein
LIKGCANLARKSLQCLQDLSPFWTTLQFTYDSSSPLLGESSLVAEALADARCHHKERLHDNQPEWRRCTRGAQQEATAQQELEAPADGRHWHDERQQRGLGRMPMAWNICVILRRSLGGPAGCDIFIVWAGHIKKYHSR